MVLRRTPMCNPSSWKTKSRQSKQSLFPDTFSAPTGPRTVSLVFLNLLDSASSFGYAENGVSTHLRAALDERVRDVERLT